MRKMFAIAIALTLICSTVFAGEVKEASSSCAEETKAKEYVPSQAIPEDADVSSYDNDNDGVADFKTFDEDDGMINEKSQDDDSWI
ncbi:MAG: hypothetical protein ABIH85_07660 [Candidatus Omnitrophota bacterium]|nr:hypothetical protein [Candidatus Omnitrophota bacterium]MBU1894543.1 hypothetical protein [Candidatus Omnitrophota bacterium]